MTRSGSRGLDDTFYLRNNISFRVLTARCISTFKAKESELLAEAYGHQDRFSPSELDTLLLQYRFWYRWLERLDDLLIRKKELHEHDLYNISFHANSTFDEGCRVLHTRNNFDPKMVSIFVRTNKHLVDYLTRRIVNFPEQDNIKNNMQPENLFLMATSILIDMIGTMMFELDEIHAVLDPEEPLFLSYDDICVEYRKVFDRCLIVDRATIYKDYIDFSNVALKVYANGKTDAPKYVYDELEKIGVNIVETT